jgi:CMP-N,N'-diacetyllegionaminic acid synthase
MIAFIPARYGSKRLPGKNIMMLKGHPLIAYTIAAARDTGIFDGIYCSSDSPTILEIAESYGALPILRPEEYATDRSPDSEWIHHALGTVPWTDSFAILRPTSPFRTASTIARAFNQFSTTHPRRNMKALEPVTQHPHKMWVVKDKNSALPFTGIYNHLLPTQSLPTVYVQNACIEMRWNDNRDILDEYTNVRFANIIPFFTVGYEGVDINDSRDWAYVEWLIRNCLAELPTINY